MSEAEVQVTLAVLRDPTVETPANIADTGSRHWQGIHVIGSAPQRERYDRALTCRICGQPAERCRRLWADDHALETVAEAEVRRTDLDVHRTVEALAAPVPVVREAL